MNNKSMPLLLPLFAFLCVASMGLKSVKSGTPYEEEVKEWHRSRIENLKKEDGWLNLAGLYWLEEGKNTFGAAKTNAIVFPKGKSEESLGTFTLDNGEVFLETTPEKAIFNGNEPVTNLKIFPSEENIILKHQSLRWFIIKRGSKYGVRLRDLDSPFLKEFTGIETFPIDANWKIKAKFVQEENKKIAVLDVLGQTTLQDSPGKVVFSIHGKQYSLDALNDTAGLFIIFADKTNKKQTYGAGRFLYTDKPDANGIVYLDFNKAINPPCAFTPYATCPLPPKQNVLPVTVYAGEKNYGHH